MTKIEEVLLSEMEKAWDMVFLLDERRIKILQFYSAVFAAIIGFAASLIANANTNTIGLVKQLTTIMLCVGILIGVASIVMLCSERAANVRYRLKINLIRGLLLSGTQDPIVTTYLKHKELGIKTIDDREPPRGVGRTLKGIFPIIIVEIVFQFVGIVIIWGWLNF